MIYQIEETTIGITLFYVSSAGTTQTGKSIRLYLYDMDSGSLEINAGVCVEVIPGLYRYQWTHGKTTNKSYAVLFRNGTTGGSGVAGAYNFRIVNTNKIIQDTVDLSDGRAV